VRIGRLTPQLPDREQTYRVYFTELPSATSQLDSTISLRMRLRVGIPVFSEPLIEARPILRIVESRYEDGELKVRLHNSGNSHARVSSVHAAEYVELADTSSPSYILPGASQEFVIQIPPTVIVSTIQTVSDQLGTIEYDLDTGSVVVPVEAELASR
jgi:P pilus assembly chaperone PapD